MIAKKNRLPREEFPWKGGTIFSSEYLTVKISYNKTDQNRFACVMRLKTVGSPSSRNVIKRRILGRTIRLPNVGSDFLFLVKKKILNKKTLNQEFDKIISKVKI